MTTHKNVQVKHKIHAMIYVGGYQNVCRADNTTDILLLWGVYTYLCDNLKSSSVSIDGEELSYRAEDCVLKRTITSGVFG